ncbi:hypothetical protein DSLASN_13540 [Desulfoluna limicola]|uniref:Transposase n=1 Tax=Desulfoluna limicola TaxID=2810562 RepID=A0ABM7PEX8_9BACT|nr:hypothetical protein DSLASN_13540 [Desulfoluna limicola]
MLPKRCPSYKPDAVWAVTFSITLVNFFWTDIRNYERMHVHQKAGRIRTTWNQRLPYNPNGQTPCPA